MGEITNKIVLYNRAYRLAWDALPEHVKTIATNTRLDHAVWEQIRDGATDPKLIAEMAVTALMLRQQ